jgi:hypothetical protein
VAPLLHTVDRSSRQVTDPPTKIFADSVRTRREQRRLIDGDRQRLSGVAV